MRMRFRKRLAERGSVLIVALFVACILGIGLGSCLILVRAEHDAVVRSQAWNAALLLAEAGVEEALARLNPGAGATPLGAGGYGPVSRSLSAGSYDVVYVLGNVGATIYGTGHVAVPSVSATLSRVVRVTTTNAPLFTTAVAAGGPLDLNGARLSSDSYDSADPNLSNNGGYPGWLSSKTSTNGDVATAGGVVDASYIRIHGDLFVGADAALGSGGSGSVSGTVHHDLNVDLPDVVLPSTVNWLPAAPVVYSTNGTAYETAFFQSGSYTISALSGRVYVGAGANVTLLVSGDASVGDIYVAGTGSDAGKLTIYMTGAHFTVNGGMTVESGLVTGFAYYGAPGNSGITLSGTSGAIGTIYAPNADLEIVNDYDPWYWNNETFELTGSAVTKSTTVNGYYRARFHYDENLKRPGAPRRGYLATAWHELP